MWSGENDTHIPLILNLDKVCNSLAKDIETDERIDKATFIWLYSGAEFQETSVRHAIHRKEGQGEIKSSYLLLSHVPFTLKFKKHMHIT